MANLGFRKKLSTQKSDDAHPCVHHRTITPLFSQPELPSNAMQASQPSHSQVVRNAGPALHPSTPGASPLLQPSIQSQEEKAVLLPTPGHSSDWTHPGWQYIWAANWEKSSEMICIGKHWDCSLGILSKTSATLAPSGNINPVFITSPHPGSMEKWKANAASANISSHIYWNLLTPRLFLLAKCTMSVSECKFYCLQFSLAKSIFQSLSVATISLNDTGRGYSTS